MHQVLIGLREQRPSNALDMKEKMEVQVTIRQGIPWKTLGLQASYVAVGDSNFLKQFVMCRLHQVLEQQGL